MDKSIFFVSGTETTILRDIDTIMIMMHEETFRPVAPVQKFSYDEETIFRKPYTLFDFPDVAPYLSDFFSYIV